MTSDMFRRAWLALAIVSLSVPTALAQGPLRFVEVIRETDVLASVVFDNNPDDCGERFDDEDEFEIMGPGFYTFAAAANAARFGGIGASTASQDSTVRADRIEFDARVEANATLGSACEAEAGASASKATTFTVSRQVNAALTGRIEVSGVPAITDPTIPFATVVLSGFSPTGGFLNLQFSVGLNAAAAERDIFEPVTLFPDGTYAISVGLAVNARTDEADGPAFAPLGFADAVIALNLGDADEDGLLDEWEINGIDVDEDGVPELDLPAMGADPMRKDLFVEIDAMQSTSNPMVSFVPAPGALADVRAAFANVPAALVSNPDGSGGITLHTIVDETNLPETNYPPVPADEAVFQALKDAHYGTPAERADPKWELIERARLVSFRYCIWGGTRAFNQLGYAEIVGDDFMVTLGTPEILGGTRDEQAGTFMHELGHTLGLRHGGGDDTNFKPNYVSVMNYPLSVPWRGYPTPLFEAWALDFSREVLPTIDENAVSEFDGFGSVAANLTDRRIYVNNAPLGTTTAGNARIVPVNATPIDLNNDGDFDDVLAFDLNRSPITPPKLDVHVGFNDWTALNLPLAGSDNFGKGALGTAESTNDLPGGEVSVDVFTDISEQSFTQACNQADLVATFGVLDLADIDAFIAAFIAGDPAADLVPTIGVLDLADIDAFIAAFLAGCP